MTENVPWSQLTGASGRDLIELLSPWRADDALSRLAKLRADPRFANQPELVAAAATQARLRTRAATRFPGPPRWWTEAGLEQATRPAVAELHATQLVTSGVRVVHDLGCGVGSDSLAFAAAGMRVNAVDRDLDAINALQYTASDFALDASLSTHVTDIASYAALPRRRRPNSALFLDPARRRSEPRASQDVRRMHPESWSPRWSWVCALAAEEPALGAKVAPGIAHDLLPPGTQTQWISQDGDLLEAAVWWAALARRPGRGAVILRAGRQVAQLDDSAGIPRPDVGKLGEWLFEPDPAVIRSGLVSVAADQLDGWLLDPRIAYVTGRGSAPVTPLGTTFQIIEEIPPARRALRAWLVARGFGNVTIKKRGLDVDPVELRRWLRLRGPGPDAIIVLTRTDKGPLAVAVQRVQPHFTDS